MATDQARADKKEEKLTGLENSTLIQASDDYGLPFFK
jgi:hypothetical protein